MLILLAVRVRDHVGLRPAARTCGAARGCRCSRTARTGGNRPCRAPETVRVPQAVALAAPESWEGLLLVLILMVIVNSLQAPGYLSDQEPDQPVQAVYREDHHRADHDLRHHQRRDRPLGCFGDGPRRLVALPCSSRASLWGCSHHRAADRAGMRRIQRILDCRRRHALPGRHACRADLLPRPRARLGRRSVDHRLPGSGSTAWARILVGPVPAGADPLLCGGGCW